jgi:hypothetical protein
MGQENNNAEEEWCGRFRLPLIDVMFEIVLSSTKQIGNSLFRTRKQSTRGTDIWEGMLRAGYCQA